MSAQNRTNTEIKIPMLNVINKYGLILPGQYIMPPNLSLSIDYVQNTSFFTKDNEIIFSKEQHFYQNKIHEYTEHNLECKLNSIELCTIDNFDNEAKKEYENHKGKYDNIITLRLQDIQEEIKLLSEIANIIKECIVNMHELSEKIYYSKHTSPKKKKKYAKEKIWKYFLNEINKTTSDEFYNKNTSMNIKNNNEQGKHVSCINIYNKNIVSSTVLKEQMFDNKNIENIVYDTLTHQISTKENEMMQYIRNVKNNDKTFYRDKQNRCLQIILNNYGLTCIMNRLIDYINFLKDSKIHLNIYPYLVTNDAVCMTKILKNDQGFKLIYKMNDNELNKTSWNFNESNMIYDKIYLINMYNHQMFIKPKNSNEIFNGFGYVLAHSKEKNKWNLFPTDDERINYNDVLREKYNADIHKYVTE